MTFFGCLVVALALLLLLGGVALGLAATNRDDNTRAEYVRDLRVATPPHYQGRHADFDERGRPW